MSLRDIFNGPYFNGDMLPSRAQTIRPLTDNQIRVKRIKAKRRRKANRGKRK